MPRTVSQKRFVKGLINSVGTLSQAPGSLTRMSNLVLSQRGSLQTADGTASIGQLPSPFTQSAWIDLFTKFASGQYPIYCVLANPPSVIMPDVANFSVGQIGVTGANPAGTYSFAIVANGGYGSVTGLNSAPAIKTITTLTPSSGFTFLWSAPPYAQTYDIYYLTSPNAVVGNKIASAIPGTPSGGFLNYTLTITVTPGTTPIPQTNNSYVLQLLVGAVSPPDPTVIFSPVINGAFLAEEPQPAQLAPGDPNFVFDAITTTPQTYTPTGATGSDNVTANSGNPTPSSSFTMSGFPSVAVSDSQNLNLYVQTSGSVVSSGSAAGYGVATYEYSIDGGSTWNNFTTEGGTSSGLWSTLLSTSIPSPSSLSNVQVRVTVSANWFFGGGASITTTANVTNVYITTSTTSSFSPYGGVVGLACPIPIELQFAGFEILILGNGVPPQQFDPSLLAASTPAALTNSFQAGYPTWQSGVEWITGAQLTAASGPTNYLFTVVQGGVSGTTTPTWNFTPGTETADGSVIWRNSGPIAPISAPRGAAQGVVYAGSLWIANTSPSTTSDQLDGPTVIKMSDANNPNSWNPLNTAFVGRDDGSQITGMQPFTIAAVGISPTGSMAVFKEFLTYQIIGVFGSNNFEIQEAQTDMGCLAARSIQFIPGFGVVRWSHLGFAVYDGVNDRLISEEIRPFLFGGIKEDADIVPVDTAFVYLSKSAQAVQPPMYMCAMPLQGGNGVLNRLFCYDLILKAWIVIDLPFPVTSLNRVKAGEGNPLVLCGKSDDGTVQRMQAGDVNWDSTNANTPVTWDFRTPDVYGEGASQKIFYREMTLRGYATVGQAASVVITPTLDGATKESLTIDIVPQDPNSGQFEIRVSLFLNGQICYLDIAGQGQVLIDSVDWSIEPKAQTARRVFG